MSNELAIYNQETFEIKRRTAQAMVQSRYFKDAGDVAQAFVKIQAGAELGLPPFASMTGIHIIQGKPVLGSNVIATLIKNDPRYDYRVNTLDDDGCTISFYEDGAKVGESSFNKSDAKQAGLTSGNWTKYPRNMYFARAISNGARWYTPGIFGGSPVYTPDEMGVEVDEDGYIEGELISSNGQELDEALARENAHALGADFDDTGDDDTEPSDDTPEFDESLIADSRAWLEEKINGNGVQLGIVADALIMTGLYNARKHVTNWLDSAECKDLRDKGLKTDTRAKVSKDGAFTIFDRAVARKEPTDA